jgi:hypothetical protein
VDIDHIAQKAPLELSGRVISTNLIVLRGARNRRHPRDEMDEVTQCCLGHSYQISPLVLIRAWKGNSAPSYNRSQQGFLTSYG